MYVTEYFRNKLRALVVAEFMGQDVDLLPIMECELSDKMDELVTLVDEFKKWQVEG